MKKTYKNNNEINMSVLEHLKELRERIFIAFSVFCIIAIICLVYAKKIAFILQQPASGIKFLQLAPGEYLFVSIKIALYLGITISSPFSIYQILLFVLPGLNEQETKYLIPTIIGSIILFFSGLLFSYYILVPAALNFLISYGSDIVEPVWSFEEYFNFVLLLLISTAIAFQIPILQIFLGLFGIISWQNMLKEWKYIAFIATILGAIITPSTDPVTQICMTSAILLLYFIGIFILKILNQ
uniref:Sec-independent protein translocase component TatC n=1 Tax=Bostrychia simpliciuscula TaxID=324754 RepID=A0A1Z1M874_9FLOR|nr:Sec-independent protein translocase component TatC [Bostrychia simpliciuscula]ARW62093.1 Sec-independent protein translocase component TatC [Bostrychia simpliciuscula]